MKEKYIIPIAIIIAGLLIAIAILISPAIWKETKAPTKENNQNTQKQLTWEEVSKKLRLPDNTDWVRGDLNKAKAIFIEYSDLECPYCKKFHETMLKVLEKYGDKVAWVYRHFPIENLHKKAMIEAIAAECVGKIGGNNAFWSYIDKIFEVTQSNDRLDLTLLPKFAEEVEISKDDFLKCYNQKETQDKIKSHMQELISLLGDRAGTPFTVLLIGEERIPIPGYVPFENIDNALSQMLK
jgi:protein-disulfide isomerase